MHPACDPISSVTGIGPVDNVAPMRPIQINRGNTWDTRIKVQGSGNIVSHEFLLSNSHSKVHKLKHSSWQPSQNLL